VFELLPGLLSNALEPTEAVFESTVPSGVALSTWTVIWIATAPTASEPLVHCTVPVAPTAGVVHDHPGAEIDWNVVFAGRLSVTTTLVATSGPPLVTVIVYVRSVPATTGSGESLLSTDRSAFARFARQTPRPTVPKKSRTEPAGSWSK
jgi:hypothetical protein